ncbi:hypothetical protein [Natrinema salaciae]|uniref:J domain-containing protein n=1 Tax=Natrinema salaciae TaxID=1186196 RepID=A0A1H8ZKC7_9EURY|nr:hypothetical protein [Natrinema salaciae]SEP64969.1 hypothetical protein SAMN04489841_0198 [Natrinema salaciae]
MDDVPDPFANDAEWGLDTALDGSSPTDELTAVDEWSDATTYYDVLDLDRLEAVTSDDIRRAYLDALLDTDGDGDEERARSKARTVFEARYALMTFRAQYDEMVRELGPRLGHQAFVQWRVVGEPSNVHQWIVNHNPESQSVTDDGFEDGR